MIAAGAGIGEDKVFAGSPGVFSGVFLTAAASGGLLSDARK